jgi:hypothetical protein
MTWTKALEVAHFLLFIEEYIITVACTSQEKEWKAIHVIMW